MKKLCNDISRKSAYYESLNLFQYFPKVDIEDGSVSLQVPVSNETSSSASPHEEDNHSETASSGYASVQGADEPPLEEHVQSASKHHLERQVFHK